MCLWGSPYHHLLTVIHFSHTMVILTQCFWQYTLWSSKREDLGALWVVPFKFEGGGSSLCGCHGLCTGDLSGRGTEAGASDLVELEFLQDVLNPRSEMTGPWPK